MTSRVVFVESAAAMGGVQFSTLYLARRLDRSLWDPLVLCPAEGPLADACRKAGVPVEVFPALTMLSTSIRLKGDRRLPCPPAWLWNLAAALGNARKLAGWLKDRQPALVVTKGVSAHLFGGLAARRAGLPCLWHVQDFISERFGGLYRRFFSTLAGHLASLIVSDGTPIARQFPAAMRHRLEIIHNGLDLEAFQPGMDAGAVRRGLGIPPDALVIGHVARITPWKGQHHLVEAFSEAARDAPRACLLLVGSPVFDNDSYESALRRRVAQLGLDERVVFAGYRTDLPAVLAAMDLFAYPSVEKDTSPLALLSAMAAGLPVAAFDIPGVSEVVADAGLLVHAGSGEALAAALKRLMGDEELRLRMGRASRERAETMFGLDRHAAAMQSAFSRAVEFGPA